VWCIQLLDSTMCCVYRFKLNDMQIMNFFFRLKDLDQVLESEVIDLSKLREFCFNGNPLIPEHILVVFYSHVVYFFRF